MRTRSVFISRKIGYYGIICIPLILSLLIYFRWTTTTTTMGEVIMSWVFAIDVNNCFSRNEWKSGGNRYIKEHIYHCSGIEKPLPNPSLNKTGKFGRVWRSTFLSKGFPSSTWKIDRFVAWIPSITLVTYGKTYCVKSNARHQHQTLFIVVKWSQTCSNMFYFLTLIVIHGQTWSCLKDEIN